MKPPPKEVAVECRLCGTRILAPLEKVGQKVQCPDCYSENLVPEPPGVQPSRGPTLDDAPTFALSEEVARPRYRPLVVPRGEDAALAVFEEGGAARRVPRGDEVRMDVSPGQPTPEDGDELTLAPPEERVTVEPTLSVVHAPEESVDSLYDGRYDDGLVDGGLDPSDPEAWRRAPLMLGIVGFLLHTEVWPRWAAYAVGLTIVEAMGRTVVWAAAGQSALALALIPFVLGPVALVVAFWVIPLAAMLMAVIEETANGGDEISEWPSWDFFQWMWPTLQLGTAMLVGAMPGLVIASLLLAEGGGRMPGSMGLDWPRLTLPVVLSWWLLLPPLLYSMLVEASLARMLSPMVWRTMQQVPDAWLLYYVESLVLLLPLAMGLALLQAELWVLVPLGSALVIACLLVAARLLGRLMWYCGQRVELPQPQA